MDQQKVVRNLHTWFKKVGRDFPWRRTTDPYAILVSEIMLQQTQAKTVLRYFNAWMEKFPNMQVLAMASEDAVLKMWEGLGYYSRARNLLQAARILVQFSSFPKTPAELKHLPGIGEYTAHAIAAFAFNFYVPVIDSNIVRVLSRFFEYSQPVNTFVGMRDLRKMAMALLPTTGGGRLHNAALMELGALVCIPRKPLCRQCPLHRACRSQNPESLPIKRLRACTKKIEDRRAFCCDGESIWLVRSTERWWIGLWVLPTLEQLPSTPCDHIVKFSVTCHKVMMQIWRCCVTTMLRSNNDSLQKTNIRDLERIAIPTPHRCGIIEMLKMFLPGMI